MSTAGTAVAADAIERDSAVASENALPDSRFSILLGAVLDSLSLVLFYLPFSTLTHLVKAAWLSLIAEI
jgi:hypothetical protein